MTTNQDEVEQFYWGERERDRERLTRHLCCPEASTQMMRTSEASLIEVLLIVKMGDRECFETRDLGAKFSL